MSKMRRALALVAVATLTMALGGCGTDDCNPSPTGSSCPPTPPPSTPAPRLPVVVAEGNSALEFDGILRIPFSSPEAGELEPNVTWTHATSEMVILLANGNCTFDQLFAMECNLISTFVGTANRSRKTSLAGRAAGPYTLFVGNGGPDDESISFQVVLYPGARAQAAAPARMFATPDLSRFGRRVERP